MKTKVCKATGIEFVITDDDMAFYNKIGVPEPTLCPDERQRRKYLWRNERTLYRRICDKTGESIVSMYAPNNRFPVYSIHEWWGDGWNASDYAQEIDFSRPFFSQFLELQNKVPRLALLSKNSTNSDYSNHTDNSKDAYMCATAFDCENVLYSSNVIPIKNSLDCYRSEGTSNENLYECINIHNTYNSQFCYKIDSSFDCYYSFDLKNCSNCFLSYNLRGQSYYFRNQKYSKEDYMVKISEFNLSSYQDREKLYKEWLEIIFQKAYHKTPMIESSIGCTGNFIFESKNALNCFDIEKVEDSKFVDFSLGLKDTYSVYHTGIGSELMYESHATVRSSKLIGVHLSYDNTNLTYCDSCHNSNELFGCIGITKGSYMIFNKQYTKEEYFILKEKLIEHMKQTGEYGEFFPPELSPFSYNETQAQVYMPLTKEEAISLGYKWKDDMPGTYGRETIKIGDLPDTIQDVNDSIINQILACCRSGRNYNIVEAELELYRKLKIPLPRLHPDERYKDRIYIRPDRKIYLSNCKICSRNISTSYKSDRRPVGIVCEDCYKREVL